MYFSSKRDVMDAIVNIGVILFLGYSLTKMAFTPKRYVYGGGFELLFFGVQLIIIIWLIWDQCSCGYTIDGESLLTKKGPFRNTVKISEIKSVMWNKSNTRNMGMCLSWDRLRITMNREGEYVFVSPKDVGGFLKLLREKCPDAEITEIESPPKNTIGDIIAQMFNALLIVSVVAMFLFIK